MKRLLKVIVPISLVAALVVGIPLMGGCMSVAPPEEVEPIWIGQPIMLTGPGAADGEVHRRGTTMAMEEINAAGGVLGRPLKTALADTGTYTAEELKKALADLRTYDCVVFFPGYCTDPAFMEVFGSIDILTFHLSTMSLYQEIFASNPDYYWNMIMGDPVETTYGPSCYINMTENIPYEFPNKKTAILAVEWDYALVIANSFKEISEADGWETIMSETFPWATSEWGVQLAKIRAENPALIFFSTFTPSEAASFITQFYEDPTDSLIYVQYAPSVPEFRELLGDKANGIIWQCLIAERPSPTGRAYAERYIARWGEAPDANCSAGCYDFVYWWANAVEAVGNERDYRGIYEYILETPYEGVCGTYVLDPETNSTLPGNDYIPMQCYQIQEGKQVLLVLGDIPTEAEFIMPPWLEGE